MFSAQFETVAILKNPPIIVPSPYKGRLGRKPHHKPQLPTRIEQVNAARAFVLQCILHEPVTVPVRYMSTSPEASADILPVIATSSSTSLLKDFDSDTTTSTIAEVDIALIKTPEAKLANPDTANAIGGKKDSEV